MGKNGYHRPYKFYPTLVWDCRGGRPRPPEASLREEGGFFGGVRRRKRRREFFLTPSVGGNSLSPRYRSDSSLKREPRRDVASPALQILSNDRRGELCSPAAGRCGHRPLQILSHLGAGRRGGCPHPPVCFFAFGDLAKQYQPKPVHAAIRKQRRRVFVNSAQRRCFSILRRNGKILRKNRKKRPLGAKKCLTNGKCCCIILNCLNMRSLPFCGG